MTDEKAGFVASNRDLLIIAGLSLLVLVIYFQATGFGFINLDDNLYVYDNPGIRNGLNADTFKWAFTAYWSANWHPLTWLSHALDVQLFGMNSGMHHGVNVFFHLVNSILAFIVFRKMTGKFWESAVVAALFAVHPAHVESVAWISERKDVLSTMFWLLAMWAYIRYAEEYAEKPRHEDAEIEIAASPRRYLSVSYFLIILFFALGLMAKPMLVTLPFVLLLCDYWPLGRLRSTGDIWHRLIEKLPLFVLSAASSVVTYFAQHATGAVESLDYLPFGIRLVNAIVSCAKYVVMMFYPADLAVWYPYERAFPSWEIAGSIVLLATITAICIWQVRRRPFLIVGWLWLLGTLIPVIGIVQVGSQALADRYTYVPFFGLFMMIVYGASSLVSGNSFSKRLLPIPAAAGILVLTGFAARQTSHWRNNETLYRHALAVTSNNYLIAHNLCHNFVMLDRLDEAEPLCRQSIEIKSDYYEPYNTLGVLQFKRGLYADAEASFKQSLQYTPNYVYAFSNLAQSQARQGKADEAEESLRLAVQYSGGAASDLFAAALSDIASAYAAQEKYDKSADNLRRLLFLERDNAEARTRLALTLYYLKRYDEAQHEAEQALSVRSDLSETWNTLGLILLEKKQHDDAAKAFEKVLELDANFAEAKNNLAKARAKR